jgi:hypothetical protein
MKTVAVGFAALLVVACSDSDDPGPTAQAGSAAQSGSGVGGTTAVGNASEGGAGAGSGGASNSGGKAGSAQAGAPSASMGQVPLRINAIEAYGTATEIPFDSDDATEFCGDIMNPASLKPEGTLMRSPGTGRYFVCLGPLSNSSSAALLDAEPGAPRSGYGLYAALFHFEDPANPNLNPGVGGPANFALVVLELNEFNGRSQCVCSNGIFRGLKEEVSRQQLIDGESMCRFGSTTYVENDGRWVRLAVGTAMLTFELEQVAVGD